MNFLLIGVIVSFAFAGLIFIASENFISTISIFLISLLFFVLLIKRQIDKYQEHGYRFLEFFSMQAGDEKAEGYRFTYEKEGVTQACSNFLIKDGRTIYAFICVGREENMDADRETIKQIMATLEYA